MAEPPDLERVRSLGSVRGAVRRELSMLSERPDLTWQQLHNRLQWADPPLRNRLQAERRRRSRPGARPWVHRYSRVPQSQALVYILKSHAGLVNGCAVSPDGSCIVSCGHDNTLRVWDTATGMLLRTLHDRNLPVTGCAVSPDGTWIVSASASDSLVIWDAATGEKRNALTGHAARVQWEVYEDADACAYACSVSPDGTWIVSAGWDKTLKVWDAATGMELRTLEGHRQEVRDCAVSPDGSWIVSACQDNTLKIWDLATGSELRTLTGQPEQMVRGVRPLGVRGCAISPDGSHVVSAHHDGTVKVWDAGTGAEVRTLVGHTASVTGCAVTPDGTHIVSTSDDGTVKVWELTLTGDGSPSLSGHRRWVNACAVSPDGTWAVSAGGDATLKIWDVSTGRERRTLSGHTESVDACFVAPDGASIVSSSLDGELKRWDVTTGEETSSSWRKGGFWPVLPSPDGTWVVSTCAESGRSLAMWDTSTLSELRTLTSRAKFADVGAVSPDGGWVASGRNPPLTIWAVATGEELPSPLSGQTDLRAMAFGPDGTWIVCLKTDWPSATKAITEGTLTIWDVATGTQRAVLTGSYQQQQGLEPVLSPDGTWIVSADSRPTLGIWDVQTGDERTTLSGHRRLPSVYAVSPDGRWIASATDRLGDETVRIWDTTSGEERATFPLPDGTGLTMAIAGSSTLVFHPHEPILVCGDNRGGVHLAELVGLGYGPLVVTATARDGELTARCPACRQVFRIDHNDLGADITCLTSDCNTNLRINPFALGDTTTVPERDSGPDESDIVDFYPEGLLHKFGFGDGDMLVELVVEHGLNVDFQDLLVAVVEQLVVPRLDQQVETFTISATLHNPIRARTIDGEKADYASLITPRTVKVPIAEIIRIARTLPSAE